MLAGIFTVVAAALAALQRAKAGLEATVARRTCALERDFRWNGRAKTDPIDGKPLGGKQVPG